MKAKKNLISGEFKDDITSADAEEQNYLHEGELVPHWLGALTINLVEDFTVYPSLAGIPPQAPRCCHHLYFVIHRSEPRLRAV